MAASLERRSLVARFWFPLALLGVLAILVPGFVLFAITLAGMERDVNRWLEDSFQLSYHVPVPWWGALGMLLLPLAIFLLYFLKLKRKPLAVPSTFLWKKSIEDLHVNSLLQWIRENVLLLLQLLVVLSLIYGIMAFHLHGKRGVGKHYILLIDNSASMSAKDVEPNRLEWAKQQATKEIDASGDDDVGMVIEFNSSAEIKQSYTTNRGLLRQAVASIQPTPRPTRIDEALSLADSLANPNRSTDNAAVAPVNPEPGAERTYVANEGIATEVHLFSDGRFPVVPEFALGNLNVHYHASGSLVQDTSAPSSAGAKPRMIPAPESADNVGIVTFNTVRDEEDPTRIQCFVKLENYRPEPVTLQVQLEVRVNGELKGIPEKSVRVDARQLRESKESEGGFEDKPGDGAVTFDLEDIDERDVVVLRASLGKHRDALALDDQAWLVVGVIRKARVLIVGGSNRALEAFFDDPAVKVVCDSTKLHPLDLAKDVYKQPARNGEYDLVVFDRCAPAVEADMPRANTLFVGRPPPPWKIDDPGTPNDPQAIGCEKLEAPHVKGWMSKHPVLRYLAALHEVGISDAFKMKGLPPRTPRLIESDRDAAVMLMLSRGSFSDLVMTFPILDDKGDWATNWPLLPSFPLFLRNVLYALGNVSDAAAEDSVQPGQVKVIRPDSAVRAITVVDPRGKGHDMALDERDQRTDFSFAGTDWLGVYGVRWNDALQRNFAVNLLDAEESQIEPRAEVQIGAERVIADQVRSQPREIWKWFAFLALGILLVEWYIYNKRVYV